MVFWLGFGAFLNKSPHRPSPQNSMFPDFGVEYAVYMMYLGAV
jgi:hypothetical protein